MTNEKGEGKDRIEHKVLDYTDYQIHYFVSDQGQSELLFLLHPAFGDHRCFDSQIDFFSRHYKIISMDMLGHGLSQPRKTVDRIDQTAMHVKAILETEQEEKAHFVGVSMGSLMVQYIAYLYPEMVRSMTIVGGYNIHFENKEVMRAQRSELFRWILFALRPLKHMKKYISQSVAYKTENKNKFLEYESNFDRKIFPIMRGLGSIVERRDGHLNTCPTLLVVGDKDLELSRNAALEWHSLDPSTNFLSIPEAGHCANMDQPELFNKYLLKFLGGKKP